MLIAGKGGHTQYEVAGSTKYYADTMVGRRTMPTVPQWGLQINAHELGQTHANITCSKLYFDSRKARTLNFSFSHLPPAVARGSVENQNMLPGDIPSSNAENALRTNRR